VPDRIDEAIDRAVREMLDVEPRADLRARVIAQLPASGSRLPASGSRLPAAAWVLVPLAAAAVIVLAIVLARRSEPLPQAPAVARADQHLATEPTSSATAPVLKLAAPPRDRERVQTAGTVAAASIAGNDNGTTAIAPLKTITPIAVAPIVPDSIAPAEIAMRRLNTITDVQIAPLTPPDGRD
jgi:hypothetical protein